MVFLQLFWEFFKIGLFAIGGGTATIPFLSELARSNYGWFDEKILANMIAISESTPGPVGVNMATFSGYNAGYLNFGLAGGALGCLIATFGLVLPSFIIIIIIAKFLNAFSDNKYVKAVFYGIRPGVAALVLFAVIGIIKISFLTESGISVPLIAASAVIFGLMFVKKLKHLHPAVWIAVGAAAGIGIGFIN